MNEVLTLDPKTIKPFADQPRKRFRDIPRLIKSIRRAGQTTPIVVTRLEPALNGYAYELIDGERRLQACTQGGMKVRAILDDGTGDKFVQSVAANFCRQGHDCMEVAEAIRMLKNRDMTLLEIGEIFGKSDAWVSQHHSLLQLCPEAQQALIPDDKGLAALNFGVALLLVPLDPKLQRKAVAWITKAKPRVAEARNYVNKLAAESPGLVKGKQARKASPASRFSVLWNAVIHTEHAFDRYAGMKHADLMEVLQSESGIQRRMLLDKLSSVIDTFRGLAGDLKKTLAED